MDVLRGDEILKWRAATGDLPKDHAERVDVCFVCVALSVL